MHYQLLIPLFLLPLLLHSQSNFKPDKIGISYLGNWAIQPGAKLNAQYKLKEWSSTKNDLERTKSWFLSPEVGVFTRPNHNTNFLLNAAIGYQRQKADRKFYSNYSLSLGYLYQSQITSLSVNLSDGSLQNERENRHYFVPTTNVEWGNSFNKKLGWFSRQSLGYKLFGSTESEWIVFIEFGLNLFL